MAGAMDGYAAIRLNFVCRNHGLIIASREGNENGHIKNLEQCLKRSFFYV
jgi:hypothetical protein